MGEFSTSFLYGSSASDSCEILRPVINLLCATVFVFDPQTINISFILEINPWRKQKKKKTIQRQFHPMKQWIELLVFPVVSVPPLTLLNFFFNDI